MSVVERVMKAYTAKYRLTPEQTARVRLELARFIGELRSAGECEPATPSPNNNGSTSYPAPYGANLENPPSIVPGK